MRIVITGGAGFLGRKLAAALLARGTLTDARGKERAIERITLVDVAAAPASVGSARARTSPATSAIRRCVDAALAGGADSVFHLAAVVSGEAETNFDLGWRVNVDATRLLLERCRALPAPPKFVFTSSMRGIRRAVARPRSRRPGAVAAIVVRQPESDRRIPRLRFHAQGFRRRPQPAPADDQRASGQAQQGRIVVRERHPARAAQWHRSDLPGQPGNADVAAVAARRDCEHDRRRTRRRLRHSRTRAASTCPGISIPVVGMIDALRRVAGDAVADRVVWRHDPRSTASCRHGRSTSTPSSGDRSA